MNPKILTIKFDADSFELLLSAAMKFWFGHLLPQILSKRLSDKLGSRGNYNVESDAHTKDHTYASCLDKSSSSGNNCPVCHTLCKEVDEINTFGERSIGCDGYNAWFHFGCIKITQKKLTGIAQCVKINKEKEYTK